MKMDAENRRKLQKFWRKRLYLGLGSLGLLGLGIGLIKLMQLTYDAVLIEESRNLPEQYYQKNIAAAQKIAQEAPRRLSPKDSGKWQNAPMRSNCLSVLELGYLRDERALPVLDGLLQNAQNQVKACSIADDFFISNRQGESVYVQTIKALGQFQHPEAVAYLQKAEKTPLAAEQLAVWQEFADRTYALRTDIDPQLDLQKHRDQYLNWIKSAHQRAFQEALRQPSTSQRMEKLFPQKPISNPKTAISEIYQKLQQLPRGSVSGAEQTEQWLFSQSKIPLRLAPAKQEYLNLTAELNRLGANGGISNLWTDLEKKQAIAPLTAYLERFSDELVRHDKPDFSQKAPDPTLSQGLETTCVATAVLLELKSIVNTQPCLTGLKLFSKYYESGLFNYMYPDTIIVADKLYQEYQISSLNREFVEFTNSVVQFNDRALDALMVHWLKNADVEVRRSAMLTLAIWGSAHEYMPAVLPSLQDPDAAVRLYAVRYFKTIAQQSASNGLDIKQPLSALHQALEDPNSQVKKHAKMALSEIDSPQNQYFVFKLMKDADPQIRAKVITSLCQQLDSATIQPILNALQDSSTHVRAYATGCLRDLLQANKISQNQEVDFALIASLDSFTLVRGFLLEDWIKRSVNKLPMLGYITWIPGVKIPSDFWLTSDHYQGNVLQTLQILANQDRLQFNEAEARKAIPILVALHRSWENDASMYQQRSVNIRVLKKLVEVLPPPNQLSQNSIYLFLNLQKVILGGIGIATLVLLTVIVRLRNPFPFFWSGYLVFPEEIIAELIVLKQRRQAEGISKRRIYLELTYEVLLLIWAVHIQMRIDDLHLPPDDRNRAK